MFIRVVLVLMLAFAPTTLAAQNVLWDQLNLAQGANLEIDKAGSTSTTSTVVKLPFAFTMREPTPERIGYKLRMPVFFTWNQTTLSDIDGSDITQSLQTLVITPGLEILIPVGDRWTLRPFAEFGAVKALDVGEYAWLGSIGLRASAPWDFSNWRLTAGGRAQYTVALDDDWQRHDDVGSLEIGGSASFPLGFEIIGGRAMGGVFLFPRVYLDDLLIEGPEGAALELDRHIEIGFSFELPRQPKILGVKLPAWYGLGYRFANDYGAWRIYLGFPF